MAETGLVDRLRVIADKLLELDRDWQRDIYEAADALAAKEAECEALKFRSEQSDIKIASLRYQKSALQEQVRGMREALKPFASKAGSIGAATGNGKYTLVAVTDCIAAKAALTTAPSEPKS